MVTKYDVFEYMYEKGGPLKPQEVANAFKKSNIDYHGIYNMLLDLKNLTLIAKNEYGFQSLRSEKNELLYQMIRFCLQNDINYNELLDKNIAAFVSKSFLKKRVTVKDLEMDTRTFSKYVGILEKNGLLIALSKKPLTMTIPYNSFLRDLVSYFGENVLVSKPKPDEYLGEINRELSRFRMLRGQNEARYQRIIGEYQIRFVHHSLSIEGNPITLPDTIKLLKEHIMPPNYTTESIQEVQNYQKAINQMNADAEEKKPLTKESILNYHGIAMQHRPAMSGKIRKHAVHIKGNPDYIVAEVREIEKRLEALLKKYNKFISNRKNPLKDILDFVAYFQNEFQHIHPFEDGNSRTTRLITFHVLRTQNIPVYDIPLGLLEEYVFSTKGARKRDDKKLNQVMQQIILSNLKSINEKLA
jgi:fido (protein-threonine AMPylation protein)